MCQKNSYYMGRLVDRGYDFMTVIYNDVKDLDGKLLKDDIVKEDVRPAAPEVIVKIEDGDIVDAWDGKAWRYGTFKGEEDDLYKVDFGASEDGNAKILNYRKGGVRIHQECDILEGQRGWVYRKNETYCGSRIEVIGFEDGIKTYYAGNIFGFEDDYYSERVKYETRKDRNGSELIEKCTRSQLRPYPPTMNANIAVRDVVDAWDRGRWWVGECISINHTTCEYLVFLDYMDESKKKKRKFDNEDLRIHQRPLWRDGCLCWSYRKHVVGLPK